MTLALISSGLIALSTPTFAAEEVAAAKKNDEKEIEVIQVSGFRKSIVESINLKRYSFSHQHSHQRLINVSSTE